MGRESIYSVELLGDGKHVVSGDGEGKIRRWCIEDGKEVGTPMDVGSRVCDIAVSRDGKWIVSGTWKGLVTVWHAESRSKVSEFNAHGVNCVFAVDVSPDATKIATGSSDHTACVWSLSAGERLLDPLEHKYRVVAAKFSPDGRLLATATRHERDSVRIYDSNNGSLLVEFPVKVNWGLNQSFAWASDSKQLFVLSLTGYIHRLNASTRTTLSKWRIHIGNNSTCIALASNETFIAASAGSSVAFWDTTSQEQIGTNVEHSHKINSMTLSSNYDLVTSGGKKITLRALRGILPSHYLDSTSRSPEIQITEVEAVGDNPNDRVANLEATTHELRIQLAESQQKANNLIQSLRKQEESSNSSNARLEKTVQELRDKLTESQRTANLEKHDLNKTINSLRTRDKMTNQSGTPRRTLRRSTDHRCT